MRSYGLRLRMPRWSSTLMIPKKPHLLQYLSRRLLRLARSQLPSKILLKPLNCPRGEHLLLLPPRLSRPVLRRHTLLHHSPAYPLRKSSSWRTRLLPQDCLYLSQTCLSLRPPMNSSTVFWTSLSNSRSNNWVISCTLSFLRDIATFCSNSTRIDGESSRPLESKAL